MVACAVIPPSSSSSYWEFSYSWLLLRVLLEGEDIGLLFPFLVRFLPERWTVPLVDFVEGGLVEDALAATAAIRPDPLALVRVTLVLTEAGTSFFLKLRVIILAHVMFSKNILPV